MRTCHMSKYNKKTFRFGRLFLYIGKIEVANK